MRTDKRGVPITASEDGAVGHFAAAVDAFLGFRLDTGVCLKAALAVDPDLAMGHLARGYFFKLFALPALEDRARHALAAAEASIAERGAHDNERVHAHALSAWTQGDWQGAIECWERILLDYPTDLLALRVAHYGHFYLGDPARLRDSTTRVLPSWSAETPGFGFVHGLHAFGLEECAAYERAEAHAREGVALNRGDIWAAHAATHVMEMQGRPREGIAWVRGFENDWDEVNNFAGHVWWHRLLFHVEHYELDDALGVYDNWVRRERGDHYLDIANAVAGLWRIEDRGLDVGKRWDELATLCEERIGHHLLVFADLHYLVAVARTRRPAAAHMIGATRAVAGGSSSQEQVIAKVGLDVAEAIGAFYEGDWGRAVDLLTPARHELWRIGGSHAQRDLFIQLLIAAALRAGRVNEARALLAERLDERPFSAKAWRDYAEALAALGDASGAKAADERAADALTGAL
jgi:tetratricopeptide (TPR) repeat protein